MWRIELLGEPRVLGYGQVITRFESKRAVALLAYLALNPQCRHPREVLVDRIWPEAPVEAGRNRLKQALASLRRLIEPPPLQPGSVLDADRGHIGLRPESFVTDVDEFRAAMASEDFERASALWRGDLLPGFYDEWLEDLRLEFDSLKIDLEDAAPSAPRTPAPVGPKFRVQIPAATTNFVGREAEIGELLDLLGHSRWITVTGYGGLGKSRLTQQVGRLWGQGDVAFVPLVNVQDAAQVLGAIGTAIGLEGAGSADPLPILARIIGDAPTLLILDNLEQLAKPAVNEQLRALLEACSGLRLLCSSRIPLHGPGETEYRLEPLAVPPDSSDPAELAANPSIRLFVERARQSRTDFQVTASNAQAVAKICIHLDGSPLAIELCAARAKLGTLLLLSRLQAGEALVAGRGAIPGDKHSSLSQVFQTTCELLSPTALELLGQLSLFRGPFEWELLEEVCDPRPDLEDLSELIEVSMVRPVYEGDVEQFSLLESVRQNAEALLNSAQEAQVGRCLAEHFAGLARASFLCEPRERLGIRGQADWDPFLRRNWENLRQAVGLARQLGLPELAVQIVADTEWFWNVLLHDVSVVSLLDGIEHPTAQVLRLMHLGSRLSEAELERGLVEVIANHPAGSESAAKAKLNLAKMKVLRQHMDGVHALATEAAADYQALGIPVHEGMANHLLANAAIELEQEELVSEALARARNCFRTARSEVDLASLSYTQARYLYRKQRWRDCLGALFECRNESAPLDYPRLRSRLSNLFGVIYQRLGDESTARVYFFASFLQGYSARDARAGHIPLWNLYLSLGREQRYEEATPIMAYAIAIFEQYFAPHLDADDQPLYDAFCAEAEAALGMARFQFLVAEGRRWSLDQALGASRAAVTENICEHREEILALLGPKFEHFLP